MHSSIVYRVHAVVRGREREVATYVVQLSQHDWSRRVWVGKHSCTQLLKIALHFFLVALQASKRTPHTALLHRACPNTVVITWYALAQ